MIEITHKQAQRMIREEEDRPLPEAQWAMLQAHLESCPDCRAYRQRLTTYDRDLIRSLRARWGSTRGPREGIADDLLALRQARKQRQRRWGRAGLWALAVCLFVGFIAYREITAPHLTAAPTPLAQFEAMVSTQHAAATQTPQAQIRFRGVAAFESRRDGNSEIYLLSVSPNGTELVNLTRNPAQDTSPVWSPDGEWIAFLSDRSGKNEVYVIHVAGSRLTQLTDNPQIAWEGPLDWSIDGRWIGLTGRQSGPSVTASHASWDAGVKVATKTNSDIAAGARLYLVSLDGQAPSSLAGSYGMQPRVSFSAAQEAVLYSTARPQPALMIANLVNGWSGVLTVGDSAIFDVQPVLDGAYDWSLGGHSAIYVVTARPSSPSLGGAAQAGRSEIHLSQEVEAIDHINFTGTGAETIDSVDYPLRFRAVSWMPHSLIVASLVGSDADGCWQIHLRNAYNRNDRSRFLDSLCVTGGLNAAKWTADGNWLMLLARKPDEPQAAIYALQLPNMASHEQDMLDNTLMTDNSRVERLVDLSGEPESVGGPAWAEPQVRPTGRMLNINPRAAARPALPEPPAARFPSPAGHSWVVYSAQNGLYSQIFRANPDGAQRAPITDGRGRDTCPRLAPDGMTVAFLNNRDWANPLNNEIFLTSLHGGTPVQLTNDHQYTSANRSILPMWHYDCPVWSPEGKRLAAVLHTQDRDLLAIIPLDRKTPSYFLHIERVQTYSAPVWVPKDAENPVLGANEILLVYPRGIKPVRLVSIALPGPNAKVAPTAAGVPTAAAQGKATPPSRLPTLPPAPDWQPDGTTEIELMAQASVRLELNLWDDIQGLTLSPDGKQLAGILVYLNEATNLDRRGQALAKVQVMRAGNLTVLREFALDNYDTQFAGRGGLFWLNDNRLGLARVINMIGQEKTAFEVLDPLSGYRAFSAQFGDAVMRAAWPVDNNWVIFSADSGMWALNLDAVHAGQGLPGLLSEQSVFDVDWR